MCYALDFACMEVSTNDGDPVYTEKDQDPIEMSRVYGAYPTSAM